jgi:hypothetical protein
MKKKYGLKSGSDFHEAFNALKIYERTFILSPRQWRTEKLDVKLDWAWVRFTEKNVDSVPDTRGLYAFIVEHHPSNFPPHGYIMYVGITGDTSDDRSLRLRFRDYLRERNNGRSKVVVMLNQFKKNLFFHFAPVPDKSQSLEQIETALLSAIIPPCNESFDATIRQAIKALR